MEPVASAIVARLGYTTPGWFGLKSWLASVARTAVLRPPRPARFARRKAASIRSMRSEQLMRSPRWCRRARPARAQRCPCRFRCRCRCVGPWVLPNRARCPGFAPTGLRLDAGTLGVGPRAGIAIPPHTPGRRGPKGRRTVAPGAREVEEQLLRKCWCRQRADRPGATSLVSPTCR